MPGTTITAGTTRTQAGATLITEDVTIVNVSTAPSAGSLLGDGVLLPAIGSGSYRLFLVNSTSNPIQVYGNGADTINGIAGSTGVAMSPNSVEVFVEATPGAWQFDSGVGTSGQLCTMLALGGISAAGANQAAATLLVADFNRVTTATANQGVKLPASAAGLDIFIHNHSGVNIVVYGNGTDTIDDIAGATGVTMMNNSVVLFTCYSAGKWYTNGLATGYAGNGLQTVQYAVIAGSTTVTQAAGTPITSAIVHVTSSANPTAVTLPVSTPGLTITVALATAANGVTVFPNAGGTGTEQINALAANAGYSMGPLTSTTFICAVAGQWFTAPRVAS